MDGEVNTAELLKQQQRESLRKLDAEQASRMKEKTASEDENARLRIERRNSAKLLSDTEQARRIAAQQAEVRKAEDEEKTERAANRAAAVAAMEEVAAAPLSSIEPATHPRIETARRRSASGACHSRARR